MTHRPSPPHPREIGGRPPPARLAHLDRLKLGFVAAIIAVHAIIGYSGLEGAWPYAEVRETRLSQPAEIALGLVAVPGAGFALGLFFLISGLLTPPSLERKGPRTFARDRLARLGVPLAVWTVAVWPATVSVTHRLAGRPSSYLEELGGSDPALDTGPMWFVAVLLAFSLTYAGWRAALDRRPDRFARATVDTRGPSVLRVRTLMVLAVAVSLATLAVRQAFPFASGQIGQAHLWQWPQYVALFGLGVLGARNGWLAPVPDAVRRAGGVAALCAVAAFVTLAGAVIAAGDDPYVFFDRPRHWAPFGLAALEGPLAVGAALWLLGFAQRRLDRPPRPLGRVLARSAFAAYIVQAPVLLAAALALRPLDVPAEAKALVVASAGVVASFAIASLLVSRTPVGRVL